MKEKIFNALTAFVSASLIFLTIRPTEGYSQIEQPINKREEVEINLSEKVELPKEEIIVNEYELSLMAHLLMGECGATYNEDEMLYLTGVVVLNRVQSEYFPNSIEEVIYQPSQYQCTELEDSGFYKEPTERCWRIAEDLLIHGYDVPNNVLYQAEFKQGSGVYKKVQNMYFCYR